MAQIFSPLFLLSCAPTGRSGSPSSTSGKQTTVAKTLAYDESPAVTFLPPPQPPATTTIVIPIQIVKHHQGGGRGRRPSKVMTKTAGAGGGVTRKRLFRSFRDNSFDVISILLLLLLAAIIPSISFAGIPNRGAKAEPSPS